jgi:hypothetical protein
MDESQLADLKALHERELLERQEVALVARHWTLAQAAAWIVFRDISSVALFTPPHATGFITYLMYPKYWTKPVVHEQWHDLFRKLEADHLVATGRRAKDGIREPIPASAWIDLVPEVDAGPYLSLQSGAASRPWTDMLVLRADVERLWRRASEVDGRSKFSKVWFQDRYRHLREANPASSKNELMEELQEQFQKETKREAPSRSSLQDYLKGL